MNRSHSAITNFFSQLQPVLNCARQRIIQLCDGIFEEKNACLLLAFDMPRRRLHQLGDEYDGKSGSESYYPHDENHNFGHTFAHTRFQWPENGHVSIHADSD